jgi:hypothetical protein
MEFQILSSIYKVFGIYTLLAGVYITGELRLPSDKYTGEATNLLMPNAQGSPSCIAHQGAILLLFKIMS